MKFYGFLLVIGVAFVLAGCDKDGGEQGTDIRTGVYIDGKQVIVQNMNAGAIVVGGLGDEYTTWAEAKSACPFGYHVMTYGEFSAIYQHYAAKADDVSGAYEYFENILKFPVPDTNVSTNPDYPYMYGYYKLPFYLDYFSDSDEPEASQVIMVGIFRGIYSVGITGVSPLPPMQVRCVKGALPLDSDLGI